MFFLFLFALWWIAALCALAVALAPPITFIALRRWSWLAATWWAAGLVLLGLSVFAYGQGIEAAQACLELEACPGSVGFPAGEGWLLLAVAFFVAAPCAALTSALLARRH